MVPSALLVDTDGLIDYLRGYPPAVEWLPHFPMLPEVLVPYRKG